MMRYSSFLLTGLILAVGLLPSRLEILAALKDPNLNRHDTERFERGYYEQLLDRGTHFSTVEPAPFDAGRLCEVVPDLREYVLKPNLSTAHQGVSWTTNSLGMRDCEYSIAKPANNQRIALVGDSIGAGWGVDDGLAFESLTENALGVEILNFSVPGHAPGQRWEQFKRVGWQTSPDVVIFEATPADPGWDERRLRGLLTRNIGWDAPQYRDAIIASHAKRGGDFESYKLALKPLRWAILENVYRDVVTECRSRNVLPVWILIPRVGKPIAPEDRAHLVKLAKASGFAAVHDFSDAYDGMNPADLAIAPNDFHPNVQGHRILADRLENALRHICKEGQK